MLWHFYSLLIDLNNLIQNCYASGRNAEWIFNSPVREREQNFIKDVKAVSMMLADLALHKNRHSQLQQLILRIYNTS